MSGPWFAQRQFRRFYLLGCAFVGFLAALSLAVESWLPLAVWLAALALVAAPIHAVFELPEHRGCDTRVILCPWRWRSGAAASATPAPVPRAWAPRPGCSAGGCGARSAPRRDRSKARATEEIAALDVRHRRSMPRTTGRCRSGCSRPWRSCRVSGDFDKATSLWRVPAPMSVTQLTQLVHVVGRGQTQSWVAAALSSRP